MERVFGFEILPAPFVVAHLQISLLLAVAGRRFAEAKKERAAVYLTNALTGWEPPSDGSRSPSMALSLPNFFSERDAAERVKQATPILVILGNPPYNGFAGVAVAEERDLSQAYRVAKRAPNPQGQGLNDLVRPLLPHGRAAHRGEDRPGHRLLHLELFLARWPFLHRHARTLP